MSPWWDDWDDFDSWREPYRGHFDEFRGYDLWKSDVGPWPSVGDYRPPLSETELDLSGDEIAPIMSPEPETELDLTGDEILPIPTALDLTGDDAEVVHDLTEDDSEDRST
jgi:hypothetical protein